LNEYSKNRFCGLFFFLLLFSIYTLVPSFSQSSNRGINWKEVCETADSVITEPCKDLVKKNNPYELTREGERVLGCFLGGGALLLFPDLLYLAPLGKSMFKYGGSNNNNDVGNMLSGFLGK
jgi:hypothetical protein